MLESCELGGGEVPEMRSIGEDSFAKRDEFRRKIGHNDDAEGVRTKSFDEGRVGNGAFWGRGMLDRYGRLGTVRARCRGGKESTAL